jgi:hypothetical protein
MLLKSMGSVAVSLLLTTCASARLVSLLDYGEYRKQFGLSTAVIVATVDFLDPNCLDNDFDPQPPPGVTCHTVLRIGHSYKGKFAAGATVEVKFHSNNAYDDGTPAGQTVLVFLCGSEEHPVYCPGMAGRVFLPKGFTASGTGVEGLNDDVVAGLPESARYDPLGGLLWGMGDNPRMDALRKAADADATLGSRVEIEAILIHAGDSKCAQCLADIKTLTEMKQFIEVNPWHITEALSAAPAGSFLEALPWLSRETPGGGDGFQMAALEMLAKVPVTRHLDVTLLLLDRRESIIAFRAVELVRKAAGYAFGLQQIAYGQFDQDATLRQRYVEASKAWIHAKVAEQTVFGFADP